MAITPIRLIDSTKGTEEHLVGKNSPTLPDVLNRPLQDLLSGSGYATTGADFAGFAKSVHTHLTADITDLATAATGITKIGILLAGAVAASLVTAGTFGAGAYTFPSTVAVAGALTPNGGVTISQNGKQVAQWAQRTLNGDANALLLMGIPNQVVADQVAQTYIATISPPNITTSGAGAAAIGFNIGQWIVTATDTGVTRAGQFCNIEHDFIQLQMQTGGNTATFNSLVSSRFRFAIPKTGVTVVDNLGISFVVPLASDVTGSITNMVAVDIPALTNGGATNYYGIRFANTPNAGSIVAMAGADLTLNAVNSGNSVIFQNAGAAILTVSATQILAAQVVRAANGVLLTGAATLGVTGARQFSFESPVTRFYTGDGSGYAFAFSKRAGSVTTDLWTITDNAGVTMACTLTTNAPASIANGLVVSGSATLGVTNNRTWSYESPTVRYYIGDGSGYSLAFSHRAASVTTDHVFITDKGDVILNATGAALVTGAVVGFPFLPTMAGAPTGAPSNAGAGKAALVYDSTNSKLWVRDPVSNTWKGVVVA